MKISIVTATYNSAKTISDTMESVLSQTYGHFEYWVIDGGSTDGTVDVVVSYAERFGGRLHCLSEPDRGIYDAMNKGIRLCTGDVVGILNSDDYYTSDDVLQTIADEFGRSDVDSVYGDIHFIRPGEPGKVVRYYSSALFKPFWLRFGFMPAHPSFYVRRHIYEKFGGYALDYKIAADYDMMVRLFYKHKISSKYIRKDFVTMRTGGMSTKSVSHRLITTREDVKACLRYGLYTNILFVSVKYLYKVFEFRKPLRCFAKGRA